MARDQLSAFMDAVRDDNGLQEKLKDAGDPQAVLVIAKEAGFDISEDDWLHFQAKQTQDLSDEELEGAAGGTYNTDAYQRCTHRKELCE